MFKKAYEGGYAIGAFNVNNMRLSKESQKLLKKLMLHYSVSASAQINHTLFNEIIEAAQIETGYQLLYRSW